MRDLTIWREDFNIQFTCYLINEASGFDKDCACCYCRTVKYHKKELYCEREKKSNTLPYVAATKMVAWKT